MNKYTKIILIVIVILAAFLRLYKLDSIPPGINRDEASIGFTAYSLMITGHDEYKRPLPLSFESFGDWKMPLYIYITIPFIKIFGMSELAVRLPSAIAGALSVLALFYLTRALLTRETIALVASFILAIMPWHMHISRVESEAIIATLSLILGSLFFLNALKKKSSGQLITSAILLASTYYTYHGNHVSTSLLLIGMTIIYWTDIIKVPRWWHAALVGSTIAGFILIIGFSADHTKLSGISIFGDPTVIHTKIELPRLEHSDPNSLAARLVHNRITYATVTIFQNYLKSYGPDFLFIKGGGNNAHNIQGYGNLHPIEAPLLLVGIAWLLVNFRNKKGVKFILWWIAIGGVAAAITKDAPHSNRMLAVVPSFAIASAIGFAVIFDAIKSRYRVIALVLISVAYIWSLVMYFDRYFEHFPRTESQHWGYAYKKLIPIITSQAHRNKKIVMTHPEKSPYIYLVFYSSYNPRDYQNEAIRYPISQDGFTDVAGFGRFSFRAINWEQDLNSPNTLLIANPNEIPSALSNKIIETITLPDGNKAFAVVDTNK